MAEAGSRPAGVWGYARSRTRAGIFGKAHNSERGVGATLWNTRRTHVHHPGPLARPGLQKNKALETAEGAGKAGCPPHPWSACNKKHAAEPQVQADHPAFPAQWFYGLYVISPVTGLVCHRRQRDAKHHRQLGASVGAPGPHDFAVRRNVVRLVDIAASIASRPTFVTCATPLLPRRDGEDVLLIWVKREQLYFFRQDWTASISLIAFNKSAGRRKRHGAD